MHSQFEYWMGNQPLQLFWYSDICFCISLIHGPIVIVTVKVNDSATIWNDDSTGDSSGESGSDPESAESTPELNQAILDHRSSCSMYVIT